MTRKQEVVKKCGLPLSLYLVNTASRTPTCASSAGTNEPTWAKIAIKATCVGWCESGDRLTACDYIERNNTTSLTSVNVDGWLR